ncbi:MAG: enoyl-CoA hydratase-related protein [Gemmataceae bacterium]|nr:enoyl-CoA hydratase-related protein [Gemmataceae bacterium]
MLFRSDSIRLECAEQVATLWLESDRLTPTVLGDIREAVTTLRQRAWAEVLLIRTRSRRGFPTRPSLADYELLSDATARREFSRLGQETFQQIAELSPSTRTIALVEGECVDAGFELTLACDFRLAVVRPGTRFGVTYLGSGLLPCWGLTQRLPRRVGPQRACDFIEQERLVDARSALKLGLVDHVFGPRMVKSQIWWTIAEVQDRARWPARPTVFRRLCDMPWWADRRVFRPRLHRLSSPLARRVIEVMRTGWREGEAVGLLAERTAFADAGLHPDVAERRQWAWRFETVQAVWSEVSPPRSIGLAHWDESSVQIALAALAQDQRIALPPCGEGRIEELLRMGVDKGCFSFLEAGERRRNISQGQEALAGCDLVFLTGRLAQDRERRVEIERSLPPETVLVLVTSVWPSEITDGCWIYPQRVVRCDWSWSGIGFRGVRIKTEETTSEWSAARLFQWWTQCGFRPVLDGPRGPVPWQSEPLLMPAA